jgi:hypothetical protein
MVIDIPNIPELIAFINKLVPNIKIELEARSSVYSLEYTKFNGVENLEKIRKFIEKEVSEEKLEELAKLRTANTSNSNKNTITRRALLMNISSIINAIRDPFKQKMNRNINTFAVAFIEAYKSSFKEGFIYELNNGNTNAFYIERCFLESEKTRGNDYINKGFVVVLERISSLLYMEDAKNIVFRVNDINGKTLDEILKDYGLSFETDELNNDYKLKITKQNELLKQLSNKEYNVFECNGNYLVSDTYEPISNLSASKFVLATILNKHYSRHNFSNISGYTKLIPLINTVDKDNFNRKTGFQNRRFFVDFIFADSNIPENVLLDNYPFDFSIPFFSLSEKRLSLVSVLDVKPYQWKFDNLESLILDPSHKDLLTILTDDINILKHNPEDVIEGKNLGTIILSKGEPGLGKTLTAEQFCEVKKVPLYSLSAAELGTTPEIVEKNLGRIFDDSRFINGIILLDECDVFVKKRGENLVNNSIVAIFLRMLEYYSGIIFMTTNKVEEIDDAIISRTTAIINYDYPNKESKIKLFKNYSRLIFGEPFSDKLIDNYLSYLNGEISGRDIRNLVSLAKKYCTSKKEKISSKILRNLSIFKNIKIK